GRGSPRTECPALRAALTVSRPIPLLAPMIRTIATASCSRSDPPGSPSCATQAAAPQDGRAGLKSVSRAVAVARRAPGRATRSGLVNRPLPVPSQNLTHVTPQPREFHLLTLHLPTAGKGMLAECGGARAGQGYREKNSFTW